MDMTDYQRVVLPEHIQRRLDTVDPIADANAAAINQEYLPRAASFHARLDAIQRAPGSTWTKLRNLKRIADDFAAIAAPHTACSKMGKGCNHCCHIPVALTQPEAEQIAHDLGIRAHDAQDFIGSDRQSTYGYDYPCTFLRNGECSIYAQRPLSCRIHFSLDNDSLLCELQPVEINAGVLVPYLNVLMFQAAYMEVSELAPLGDIRDYFPQGLDTK